jgi:hypothetical protein
MGKESHLHDNYFFYERYRDTDYFDKYDKGAYSKPTREFNGPVIADGYIFVSRGELLARVGIPAGTLHSYKSQNVIPPSSYRGFECFRHIRQDRFFEEYVALLEDNMERKTEFESQRQFFEFIKRKWINHKHELVTQVPIEWD